MSKKVVVKKIDEENKEIILEKKDNPFIIFFRRYWLILFLTALILSLTVFILAIVYTISFISDSQKTSEVPIEVSFGDELTVDLSDAGPVSEEYVNSLFAKSENVIDSGHGVNLINERIYADDYEIVFYSDGTAKKVYANGIITRIGSLANGEYGIDKDGNIDINAETTSITILKTQEYSYGVVSYYSDGSAEILLGDGNVSMFIRNADDLYENSILDSDVSIFTSSSDNTIKYSDGSVVIISNNEYYVVSSEENIGNTDNYFKEVNRVELNDGRSIIYFANGSAIVMKEDTSISVRKSNAINIVNNKLYDITDSYYTNICNTRKLNDGSTITYYDNGSAIITDSDGNMQFVPDSNDIILSNNTIVKINGDVFDNISTIDGDNGTTINFNDYVVVKLNTGETIIVYNDKIIVDANGNFKELVEDTTDDLINFKITNNNGQDVKYIVVLEESDKSELGSEYISYRITNGEETTSGVLKDHIWDNSELAGGLEAESDGYLLLEGTASAYQTQNVNLLLYILEDGTVQNYLMDKYFYGTLKVYAWIDE